MTSSPPPSPSPATYLVLNHHTDEESAKKIIESGKILQSDQAKGDAVFGTGTYLTKMGPEASRKDVSLNNHDGIWESQMHKTKVVFEVTVPSDKVTKVDSGRDIYLHKGDVDFKETGYPKVYERTNGGVKGYSYKE